MVPVECLEFLVEDVSPRHPQKVLALTPPNPPGTTILAPVSGHPWSAGPCRLEPRRWTMSGERGLGGWSFTHETWNVGWMCRHIGNFRLPLCWPFSPPQVAPRTRTVRPSVHIDKQVWVFCSGLPVSGPEERNISGRYASSSIFVYSGEDRPAEMGQQPPPPGRLTAAADSLATPQKATPQMTPPPESYEHIPPTVTRNFMPWGDGLLRSWVYFTRSGSCGQFGRLTMHGSQMRDSP